MTRPPLLRTTDDRLLAGVCGGLADHLGIPATVVRGIMLALTLLGGAGGLLYLWLWAMIPRAGDADPIVPMRRALTRPATPSGPVRHGALGGHPGPAPAGRAGDEPGSWLPHTDPAAGPEVRRASPGGETAPQEGAQRSRWPIAELLLGACLLVAGLGFVLVRLGAELNLSVILPAMAVLVGVGLAWWQIADRDRPDRNQVPRVLGALALVAVGVLLFFVTSREPSVWTVIAAAFAVLAGVALAIAPWLLRLNRELIAERAARAREAERSDIAAHLHDSVLQTLALIQQRSEPGSEVSRIARGQERELREWLFRAADGIPRPPREAVGEELRALAAALEEEHAVRFEIVEVGALGEVPEPIIAAAREAMLNAARHAGGEVTVYAEATDARITIDVTDRGPGLDLEQLPPGRMGVRDSILGRMERAGGTARIVPGPGGGTSVRLGIPRHDPAPLSAPSEEPLTHE
ncbi:two-component system sensor kinase [Leucobacter sp. 7(1)]|uniref:ATP-binding protein n=1 Tax=Leucobacter sp. 7(1) TaxID=1255613 RepID=UPI00097EE897|nr:ATP-binding protein [Leucobacter sp. 7(1)]SJN10270.1 two-component system sensor kinase [Leucobacter sp. 7(1)]